MPNSDNKDKVRQGFTFFRSFRDAVAMTDPDEQLVLYKAIADYALDQTEPDISTLGSLGKLCWTAIRPNIESGLIRFRNGCKGGAPKGNRNACKTEEKQAGINLKTTESLLTENKNVEKDEKEGNKEPRAHIAFVVPAKREIEDYILSAGLDVDAACFLDHYTANGWMVGRNKMKDWRAALRNWARRDDLTTKGAATSPPQKHIDNEPPRPIYQAL